MTTDHVTMSHLPPCEKLTPERALAWLEHDAESLIQVAGGACELADVENVRGGFAVLLNDIGSMVRACGLVLRTGGTLCVRRSEVWDPRGDQLAEMLAYLTSDLPDADMPGDGVHAIAILAEELGARRALVKHEEGAR